MTASRPLSPHARRRLNDLLDEWAFWWTRRMSEAPALEAPQSHGMAADTGRQWQSTYEIEGDQIAALAPLVDTAIDGMPDPHRRVLHTWAWLTHYNRGVVRRVERAMREQDPAVFRSNRALLSDEAIEAATLALVPRLAEVGVTLPD